MAAMPAMSIRRPSFVRADFTQPNARLALPDGRGNERTGVGKNVTDYTEKLRRANPARNFSDQLSSWKGEAKEKNEIMEAFAERTDPDSVSTNGDPRLVSCA